MKQRYFHIFTKKPNLLYNKDTWLGKTKAYSSQQAIDKLLQYSYKYDKETGLYDGYEIYTELEDI